MSKRNDYTNFGFKIKRRHKSWTLVVAWFILMACSMYLIGLIAEQFAPEVPWPLQE